MMAIALYWLSQCLEAECRSAWFVREIVGTASAAWTIPLAFPFSSHASAFAPNLITRMPSALCEPACFPDPPQHLHQPAHLSHQRAL